MPTLHGPAVRSVFLVSVSVLLPNPFSAMPAVAQPPRLLALSDLYRLESARDLAVAPDQQSAVYVRQWIDPATRQERSALWRVDRPGQPPQPLEPGEPDGRAPRFAPDGKTILFLSTRPRPQGWTQTKPVPLASDPAVDLWKIPAAGGPAVPAIGPEKPYGRLFLDPFYSGIVFSPDGTQLAFIADDGQDPATAEELRNQVQIARADQGEGYTGYGPAQLWIVPWTAESAATNGDKVRRITHDDVWHGDPQWLPDGQSLIVHANRTEDRESVRFSINKDFDLWQIQVATGAMHRLTDSVGPDVSPRLSPDGKTLVWLNVPRKGSHRDLFNLHSMSLANPADRKMLFDHHGPGSQQPPTPPPAFPLLRDCWRDGDTVEYTHEKGVLTETVQVHLGEKKLIPAAKIAPTAAASWLPASNAFLKEISLGEQRLVRWSSTEDFQLEGVLTLPPALTQVSAPYRLIVMPHGGPHSRSTIGFDFTVQLFAASGYAVFQPNFRGSSGYTQAFTDADRTDLGGGDMRDILSGTQSLIDQKLADPHQLYLYGTSYGGFMTTWLVGQTGGFQAAAAQNPVTDLNMMWALGDLQSWTEWEFGGKPWEVADKMRERSPLTWVQRVKTPVLLLHSRDDRRCPLPMGRAYHQALKARGVPTELVIYPDEGHGIRQPMHREDVLRRVLDWFARYGNSRDHTP